MHHGVFAYGTLVFPDIAALVTGESPQRRQAACLIDHARHALRARPCPGALPCRGRSIEGVILSGLSADAADCDALIYLVRPRWRPLLSPRPWGGESFRRPWHDWYLQRPGAEFGNATGQGRRHDRAGPGR